ncbi:UNVERIFIED_ORG: adenylylsulfate kinase [Zoogloea ramigera]|uniref:Adenylyl-sulfate kinase n=1 Tax=Duganella zoogloeoides TaxID=75659 RepID=A0ABZ0XSI9_9BURK|nr:adenylyl-sulfate kinase [Duganella zoogloeoides]WQH02712.1 adenylyl-sulfate kinase [Duganella zoogloeoides]
MILLFCGLSGAGKSTLAHSVQRRLHQCAVPVEVVDGDPYRARLFTDLGFSRADRSENLRRLGFIADKFAAHGIVTIISAISPYDEVRKELVASYPNVKIVFIDCDLDELQRRDTKGLYRRASLPDDAADKLQCLSGVNDPFERPSEPDLYLHTRETSIADCTARICDYVLCQTAVARRRKA